MKIKDSESNWRNLKACSYDVIVIYCVHLKSKLCILEDGLSGFS
jgi:hypothetical protein